MTRLRGTMREFEGRRLFPTYHPADILRNMGALPTFEADPPSPTRPTVPVGNGRGLGGYCLKYSGEDHIREACSLSGLIRRA